MNATPSLGLAALLALLATPLSFAHGSGGHAPAQEYVAAEVVATPFGRQGDPRKVTRTLTVDMSDDMRFAPAVLEVRRGETVRIAVANKGRVLHEFVLGTPQEIERHWDAMKKHPGMVHEEPHMVHVDPGGRGQMVWQFDQPGEFQFACLLPGHFEAGMAGKVVVR